MTRTPPFDFAQCETHDETFPLGGRCRFDGRASVAEVYAEEADEQRQRAVAAEAQVEHLREQLATAEPTLDDVVAALDRLEAEAAAQFHAWTMDTDPATAHHPPRDRPTNAERADAVHALYRTATETVLTAAGTS